MSYNFDLWTPRLGSQSMKWQHLTADDPIHPETLINLSIAEMDLPTSNEIIQAIKERASQGIFGYTTSTDAKVIDSFISWMYRRFGHVVTPPQVLYVRGANPALDASVKAFTEPGEGVIIMPPVFQNFARVVTTNDRTLVENHLLQKECGRFAIDFDDLEAKAKDPNNKLLIFCSPNNPTSTLWEKDDLIRLGVICLNNGVKIVTDDVHQDIIRAGKTFYAIAPLFPDSKDIITITSLSKGFNLAGLQVCLMVVPCEEDKKALEEVLGRQGTTPFSMTAIMAAYTASDAWLSEVNSYIDENVRLFSDFMAKELPKYPVAPVDSTYLAWLNLGALGMEDDAMMLFLREKAKLQLNSGLSYGTAGKGYVRVNLATPKFVLEEALKRLKKVL